MQQRAIKFRAWDMDLRRMRTVRKTFDINNDGYCGVEVQDGAQIAIWLAPDEIELMQFTGICDKNGIEVYEGDVITCEAIQREVYEVIEKSEKSVVKYLDGYFYPFGYNCGWRSEVYFIEVIGNIYENPELLK